MIGIIQYERLICKFIKNKASTQYIAWRIKTHTHIYIYSTHNSYKKVNIYSDDQIYTRSTETRNGKKEIWLAEIDLNM